MDRWESSLEDYQRSEPGQSLDSFNSVLHTAESILKEDLAPFELDWFVQTLLSEPVFLIDTVSARLSDETWSKVVKDAYKLLSDLVENHYDAIQNHVDDIIEQCQKPHDARSRSHALHCLVSCVKRSLPGELASQYTAELGQASTCKAPLALLVGTICEFHPEAVADQINTIWRNFLNLLASNKNSDQVCKSLLKGVWCLFKHFGSDIPVSELNEFYNKLTREYLRKCENAVLPILRDYASLFKERLSEDDSLRRELWTFEDLTPIVPVYEEIGSVITRDKLQKIIQKEVFPRTAENYAKLKFTALRVCMVMHRRYGINVDSVLNVDVYSLEFELRKEVSYDVGEAISWSIESNMINSEKLLQTAIMFYHNLPANRRKDIVVNGLFNAPADVMHATLNFLITETCSDESSLHIYLPLWRDIFNSQIIDKKKILFEKYKQNVLLVIENFLEDSSDDKKISVKIANLLTLTSHILTLQPVEDYTRDQCALVSSKLVELTQQCGLEACIVAVARAATTHLNDDDGLKKIYEMIQIDKCKDEALLCESCLALIQASGDSTDPNVILKALEVILSRREAEPKTLCLAIQKLEKLIVDKNNSLNNVSVSKNIRLVEKLRSRNDMVGKDSRVLQRDVTIFLGKYFNLECVSDAVNSEDNTLMVSLKELLNLDVPNPVEGTSYKINLSRLLHLAIISEHEDSLRMLLNIICSKLCNNNSPLLQAALGRGIVSLCRATFGATRPDVARHAAAFCDVDATLYILQQISEAKSPAVRSMLAETIECILLKEPGSEANEMILKAVYEEVCTMMNSSSSILKLGGLDITESLLTALKANRLQTKQMLPNLLILISKTQEEDSHTVFVNASELFIENIGLFDASVLDNTITELLRILLDPGQKINSNSKAKVYKNTLKSMLSFARKLMDDSSKITRIIMDIQVNSDSGKFVYLWSELPNFFDLKDNYIMEIFDYENGLVLDKVFNEYVYEDMFALEAHLRFINQYASLLFKFHSAGTLKHISGIIENLPPKYVRYHRKNLSECLSHCRQICQNTPDAILKSFESWSESLPIKNVTEYIEKEKFVVHHALSINALNIMLDIFRLRDATSVLTTVSIFAKTWANIILRIYAKGHVKYLRKEVPFMSDLLSVSLRFLTVTDVKNILLEGHSLEGTENNNLGVDFGRFFMPVFIKYLVKKPFLLLQDGMESCSVLMNDIAKWCVRKRWHDDQLENVLELVDLLWPTYEAKASFKSKHTLLLDLSCLNVKLPPDSRPMRWVTAVVGSNEAKRADRIALVTVLPGGEAYSETYRRFASLLPTRLSDMDGASRAALRALLEALAGGADNALLDIVITLADGDETAGWWDEALASCMASLASLPSLTLPLLASLHARCRKASTAVCQRLLVPLLRCSPSSLCEKFFASILKETLESLSTGIRAPSLHPDYRACVQQKTITLDILQVLFEKVPPSKIESPSSPLYELIQTDKPWHLAREVIRLCFKLRDKLVAPDGASVALSRVCCEFQYAAYKCMCACVCMRRPEAKIYITVFNVDVWTKIVDESEVYELPLKTEWNRHKIRKTVSIVTGGGRRARGSSRSRSSSRSRVFLRTLSENPLEYDLIDHLDDDTDTQDVELADSSLNHHPCSATLTALLQHAADLGHVEWLSVLCDALMKAGRNLRWLLAEAVCNSKEELKSHAKCLRPALLAVIADTAREGCNSLHIDILNTIVHWGGDVTASEVPYLNSAINCLVDTALKNSTRKNIFRMLEDVLESVLKTYGRNIEGDLKVFEKNFDDPNRTKTSLKLLLHFTKNKAKIPGLLPWLLTKLSENHRLYKSETSVLAEVIGAEMSNSNEQEKTTAAAKLKKTLEEIKKNSVSDYVKIMYCSGCCDGQQFRVIVDLTQKLPEADRKKCLRIISTYICEHPDSPEAAEVPGNIRQMADQISVDRQFEDLFTSKPQFLMPHPAKRVKVEISSPILDTMGRNEKYISEVLTRLGKGRDHMKKVYEKLTKNNMALRFVECFYIAIYLPIKYKCENTDMSVCISTFFNMLFSHLKTLDIFKDKKLRDEPWTVAHPIGLSRSRSNRTVGTLRTFAYNSSVRDLGDYDDTEQGIDVQVTIEKILDTFVEFAKVTPEAAMELLTQLLRCLVGRGFDPRPQLAQLLSTLVTKSPEMVTLARNCLDQLCLIDEFSRTVEQLKKSTLGSEGEQLFRLLDEETKLRCGQHLFVLGTFHKDEVDNSMSEDAEFTIEGLVSAFQKLSNWDEVTCQERRRIEGSLPALWTDRERSRELLEEYTDTNGWFGQMVQLYRENRKDVMKWLRLMDKWPRRHYVVSSVIEAMQWHGTEFDVDTLQLPLDIQRGDCLAEWAARLMLRTAYLSQRSEVECAKLSRSHELRWCASANERGLHNLALSVIKRNHLDLEEDETLLWLEQKMLASTLMGLKQNDSSELQKALQTAEYLPDYYKHSTSEAIISVNKLILQLNYKLESLSSSHVEGIMQLVDAQVSRFSKSEVTTIKNKKNLADLYETAVLYYDGVWNENELSKDDILVKMAAYLERLIDQNINGAGVSAIILNRLEQCDVISDKTAATLLAKIRPIITDLPSCYMEQLRSKISLFPAETVRSCGIKELQGEPALDKYRQCLKLLCHADYLLLQYCDELYKALQSDDTSKWEQIFSRMMSRIFENVYAGADYQALTKYKNTFNSIREADTEMKRIVLKGILHDLKTLPVRETIRLSHVCPSLTDIEQCSGLERLLRLPAGLQVLKIEEEMRVFTDSVRRPCVLTALTADGRRRRYLHKNEDLRADAAVSNLTTLGIGYTVIPLSEDCGLIEFLEDHKRIRDLIATTCNIDEIVIVRQAVKDEELVLAPRATSIQHFSDICNKIPAHALRSAIESLSSSVQDFIQKKRRFQETLCDTTIASWLFGLGDRHLQNLLYSVQDGGVQCIDWGAILQYGGAELAPARLTRNMLAVCDTAGLESRLQSKLSSLRDSHQLIVPVLKISFRWMETFTEKLTYIEGILEGRMVAQEITKDVLLKSQKPHKAKYIQLLDTVFAEYEHKEVHTAEDQVSCLLLQCTDPWILSVTRTGWEPWL